MLAILFAMAHLVAAWRISAWWPRVLNLPPSSPYRMLFSIYWWPPMRLLGLLTAEAGAPPGGVTDLMLLPLSWVTCFVYGWATSLALCLPFRLLNRRRR